MRQALGIAVFLLGCNDPRVIANGNPDAAVGGGPEDAGTSDGSMPDGSGAPNASIALAASSGLGLVHLTWLASSAADGYDVYRSGVPGTLGSKVASTLASSLDDGAVTSFTPYYYTIVGTFGGVTTPSNQAKAFGYDF